MHFLQFHQRAKIFTFLLVSDESVARLRYLYRNVYRGNLDIQGKHYRNEMVLHCATVHFIICIILYVELYVTIIHRIAHITRAIRIVYLDNINNNINQIFIRLLI